MLSVAAKTDYNSKRIYREVCSPSPFEGAFMHIKCKLYTQLFAGGEDASSYLIIDVFIKQSCKSWEIFDAADVSVSNGIGPQLANSITQLPSDGYAANYK